MNKIRTPTALNWFWFVALLVLVLRAGSGITGLAAYVVAAWWGLRGGRHAVEALLFSWYITLANPGIFGDVTGGSIGRYFAIFSVSSAAILRLMAQRTLRVSHAVLATLILGSYILVHSALFSAMVPISVLKGLLWMFAVLSIILSFRELPEDQFRRAERHVYGFLAVVLLLSFPIYFALPAGSLPGYTYMRGALAHSQAMGVLGALLAIWAFSRILSFSRDTSLDFLVMLCGVGAVFLSGTRTGLLSVAATVLAVTFLAGLQGLKPLNRMIANQRSPLVAIGTLVLISGAVADSDAIFVALSAFLSKTGEAANVVDAYAGSRGRLLEEMMANIRRDPFVGIGFGIASDPASMEVQRIGGVPISAVVEKGVTPVAVWEELGLLGLILTMYWAAVVFIKAFGAGLAQVGLLAAIFLQNFGEATLFSAGGMGLLQLILIGYCSYRTSNTISLPPNRSYKDAASIGG